MADGWTAMLNQCLVGIQVLDLSGFIGTKVYGCGRPSKYRCDDQICIITKPNKKTISSWQKT